MAARVNVSSIVSLTTSKDIQDIAIQVPNSIITGEMTERCKELLLFLNARKGIVEHSADYLKDKLRWGLDSMTEVLREAETLGYITLICPRNKKGHFGFKKVRLNADFFLTDKNFTRIPKSLLETRLLTGLEKLIVCYFYVRSGIESWTMRNKDIQKIFNIGRNKLYKCLVKLRQLGYLGKKLIRGAKKKVIGSVNYLIRKIMSVGVKRVRCFGDVYKGLTIKTNNTTLVRTNTPPITPPEPIPDSLVLFLKEKKIPEIDKNLGSLISKFGQSRVVQAISYASKRFTKNFWGYTADILRKNWILPEEVVKKDIYPTNIPVSLEAKKFTTDELNHQRQRWKDASTDARKSWADKVRHRCSAFMWQTENQDVGASEFCESYLFKMGLEVLVFY